MTRIAVVVRTGLLLLGLWLPLSAGAQVCGNIGADAGGYGPWNYNDPMHRREKIPVIEEYHFTPKVQNLRGGESGSIGGDLDYTLRHVPNHHQALYTTMQLALRENTSRPSNMRYPMQCWFQRAEAFAPNDGIVRMIHGIYLAKTGKLGEGIELLEKGLEVQPGHPTIHYNLGLLYFRADRFEAAREQAEAAYAKGFPLKGLRDMLKSAGHWADAQ